MEIKLKKYQEIFIMFLDGELDLYNAPELEKTFMSLINKKAKYYVLDFEKVTYIDSSGVGVLLKLNGVAKSMQLKFVLSGVEGEVLNVLKLTNLIQFFPLADDYREGIKNIMNGVVDND